MSYPAHGSESTSPRDPDQAWFWTPEWQQMEREADEDIAAGRVKAFDTMDDLIADLTGDEEEEDMGSSIRWGVVR